ncbi:DUF1697 domain-containing protein [soil metagenome]
MRVVALLRGVNLGKHKKVNMADLRAALTEDGLTDVATYLQSGNALFATEEADRDTLRSRVEKVIEGRFGFHVPVMTRTAEEMETVVAANPYAPQAEADPTHVHAMFLSTMPPAEVWSRIEPERVVPDEFTVGDDVVYMHLPDGMGRARLPVAIDKAKLGVVVTTRNWRTVTALLDLVT